MNTPVSSDSCVTPARLRCSEAKDKLGALPPFPTQLSHVSLGSLRRIACDQRRKRFRVALWFWHEQHHSSEPGEADQSLNECPAWLDAKLSRELGRQAHLSVAAELHLTRGIGRRLNASLHRLA